MGGSNSKCQEKDCSEFPGRECTFCGKICDKHYELTHDEDCEICDEFYSCLKRHHCGKNFPVAKYNGNYFMRPHDIFKFIRKEQSEGHADTFVKLPGKVLPELQKVFEKQGYLFNVDATEMKIPQE